MYFQFVTSYVWRTLHSSDVMNLPLLLCTLNVLWWYNIDLVVKIRIRDINCVTIKKLMIFSFVFYLYAMKHLFISLAVHRSVLDW